MKIGILQCDRVDETLRAEFSDYPDMFAALLSAEQDGLHFDTYAVMEGERPEADHGCDGWVITGSRAGVYDGLPWIDDAADLLREMHAGGQRMAGICFGHQLLAQALGGRTEKAEAGWGVGRHDYSVVADEGWMVGPREHFSLQVMHQDQVVELPPGAQRLASSDFCPNAAYRIGDQVLGFQGHPEFAASYSQVLMERRRGDRIPEAVVDAGLASLSLPTEHRQVARWMLNFLSGAVSP